MPGGVFCFCGKKPTVSYMFGFMERRFWKHSNYIWTSMTEQRLFSYTVAHISLVGKLKIDTDSPTVKCFFGSLPIWPYAHLCMCYCLCFNFALYYRFHAHSNSTFALLWKMDLLKMLQRLYALKRQIRGARITLGLHI